MNKRIIVADDDPSILDVIKLILEDEGYEVETVLNGGTLLKLNKELPDLLLLDIWMSGHDGRDICRKLKKQNSTKHIPIILVSANRDVKKFAMEAGADGFIAKPFDIDHLIEIVKKYTS